MRKSIIAVALLFIVPLLSGCVQVVKYQEPSLSEPVMTSGIDQNRKPVNVMSIFATDIPEIFCSVKLSDAPPATQLRADWVYVRGEVQGMANYTLDSWSGAGDGTQYIYSSVTRPTNGWPSGDYKVVWYINGREKLAVPFGVQKAVGSQLQLPAPVAVSEGVITLGVDAVNRPLNPTSVFPKTTQKIYCSFKVSDAPPGTGVTIRWIYAEGERATLRGSVIFEDSRTVEGTLYLSSYMVIPKSGWYKGDYVVKVLVNGQERMTVPFRVQ